MSNAIAYTNCTIFTGSGVEKKKTIFVKNDIIERVASAEEIPASYTVRDLQGLNIAPAFIDLQIYGAHSKLFSSNLSTAAIAATYEYCIKGGCSHFMITLATNSIDLFLKGIEVVQQHWDEGGKGLLGLHLEGPYINPEKKGAHTLQHIKQPTLQEVELLLNHRKGVVKMITLAPEMCDPAIIEYLLHQNIIVSAGHSNASYQQATESFNKGIPTATHLFNAMSPFQSREPGIVGAVYNHPSVKSSIVPDGIHVDFVGLKLSKKLMGNRLFFITDAVTENSSGDYEHIFKGDRFTLPNGTLSGSALTMIRCVTNAVHYADISLEEALRMASTYPAELLKGNTTPMGKIAAGHLASFVVFDQSLQVKEVIAV